MAAIVGAAGLEPTLSAIRQGSVVGLANKETLVCAGSLMTAEVKRCGAQLLPVDSEHNAIFQVLDLEQPESVRSEEHTSELQSLMRNSYAVICLKNKNNTTQ